MSKMGSNWGYTTKASGEKFLAKNFEVCGTQIYDFTIYRIETTLDRLCDEHWEHPDINVLATILEMYLAEEVFVEWVEGFPMVYPVEDDFEDYLPSF